MKRRRERGSLILCFLSCLEGNHHFSMTVFGRKDFLPPFPFLPCTHPLPLGVTRELLWSMNFIFHLSISPPRLSHT